MNERIKELAQQASGEFYISAGNQTPTWCFKYDDCQRFAELIVRECIDIAKHNVMNISTYADAEFVEGQIKEHFGVE